VLFSVAFSPGGARVASGSADKTLKLCSCNKTIPIDAAALAAALKSGPLTVHTELCRKEVARLQGALGDAELLVGCTQEAPLFGELAQAAESKAELRFVNLREAAGWSAEGKSATPKMAALLAAAALPEPDPVPGVEYKSGGELLIIGALSPEIAEGLVRLGYSEPCELQIVPSGRTLAALHRSRQWRRHSRLITSTSPADVWRELCWRYVVYPASYDNRPADVVFAVFLTYHRPAIRAALVDGATGRPVPWPEKPARAWLRRKPAPAPLPRLAAGAAASPAAPMRADLPISTDV